ncbi:MAG: thiamine pyrophosphate-binding protein, partial [Verrucomicrobiota bacterium]|nr:thiamine pyrophosphate-binding protein [Verrucomicrobiota bacterium]
MNESNPEVTAQANYLWGIVVAHTLAELGIRQVFFSPGSRSTPLVIGFENQPKIKAIPVLDERTAAFLALGASKRTKSPTALLCTSGSALTHWFPGVTEAHHSSVPLLLMSADRPPELQNCGAGQTIDQEHLFGSFTRAYHSVGLPENS